MTERQKYTVLAGEGEEWEQAYSEIQEIRLEKKNESLTLRSLGFYPMVRREIKQNLKNETI